MPIKGNEQNHVILLKEGNFTVQLIEIDYFRKKLVMDYSVEYAVEKLLATIRIKQPQGYIHSFSSNDIRIQDGQAHIFFIYPLIDEGRYDASHGTWNGAWEMGEYSFEAVLYEQDVEIVSDSMVLDPDSFFSSCERGPVEVDARPQVIECAPKQPLYINEDYASFTIRIRNHRVTKCNVAVDVTAREGDKSLAGPWELPLSHQFKEQRFSTAGWEQGEYWIRVRVLVGGKPVGPYCVRKFWKQVSEECICPEVIETGKYPTVMVDDHLFSSATDIQFVPDIMQKKPDTPLVELTEPYEDECAMVESLDWNEQLKRHECVYSNERGWGSIERRENRHKRQHFKMLLISEDGENWSRPKLGLVEFEGSKDNNIFKDTPDETFEQQKAHDIEYADFRFYDPKKDGDVNVENVFITSGKHHYFPFACKFLQQENVADSASKVEKGEVDDLRDDGLGVLAAKEGWERDPDIFCPVPGEFWPMEKRNDTYLVLSREPLLYLGIGMDLMHTSEIIHCHVEQVGDNGRRRLLWYFRPGSPAYPPHGATYDNMNLCLRLLAVLWTDDGLNYHRQFSLGTDEYDPIGTQFYYNGFFKKIGTAGDIEGRPVLENLGIATNVAEAFPKRDIYLGTALVHWGIEQKQAPELIWTYDLLHFHRFKQHRSSLIDLGVDGTYNSGMIRDQHQYGEFGDDWWYSYMGVNTRHNGYMVLGRFRTVEELRKAFPNHAEAAYFPTWDAYFLDGKQTRYLPAIARCKAFRLAHAEPKDMKGQLVTKPIKVEGKELRLNAATNPGGYIRLQILDTSGKELISNEQTFEGDEVDAIIADLSLWTGQAICFQFTICDAKLYAFQII